MATVTMDGGLRQQEQQPSWEAIAARKRAALADSIPPEWRVPDDLLSPASQADVTAWPETSGWLTPEELAITSLTAAELLPKLASGELKSLDVTKAFCKRAAAAHQLTCFDRALSTAAALDARLAKEGRPVGPLHGLPVSLKDNFFLAGLDSTVGFVSHVDDPAEHEATLAVLLQRAGAVFYVKTNVPTAMMIAETVNNLFGRTVNPRNRALTSGGSSGGESALLVLGGSPVGVGTDIGGSLRIPAACTGIFTLRPSSGRFPTLGCRSGLPGQEAVLSVNGPMGRTLADLDVYCRAVVAQEPWRVDPRCLPIPWRDVELPPRLRIAVMRHDGMVRPTPPVARALAVVADKLAAAGHDMVEWDPVEHASALDILLRMFVADGGRSLRKELDRVGEPCREELTWFDVATEMGTYDMWQLHLARNDICKRYLDRWQDAGIDAILCPTTPFSGVQNGKFKHIGYTGVFNILDYSCVSFPTGLYADKSVDLPLKDGPAGYEPLGETCTNIHDEYEHEAVHGMPISLQLVAQRLEDEKVLAMAREVLGVLA